MRIATLNGRLGVFGLCAVVFMNTSGACQQEHAGELPTPAELGAQPFPAGAVTTGLDSTYARLTREEQDGTQCFSLIRLTTQGDAQLGQGCSTDGVEGVLADERIWSSRDYLGDYALLGGRVWLRIVIGTPWRKNSNSTSPSSSPATRSCARPLFHSPT
jgi:hypothetical protein